MIIDTLTNLAAYTHLNSKFKTVVTHLNNINLCTIPTGRYEIDGDAIFFTIVETQLRSAEEALLESHNLYIDIQLILRGSESFGWHDRSTLSRETTPYSIPNDITFYGDTPSATLTLQSNQLVIFLPNDAHAPLIGVGSVRKCIVKVRVE